MRYFGLKLFGLLLALAFAGGAVAQDFDTKAKFAVLMDYESGTILFHKDAEASLEQLDLLAHRRRRHAHVGGGRREAHVARHGEERGEPVEGVFHEKIINKSFKTHPLFP